LGVTTGVHTLATQTLRQGGNMDLNKLAVLVRQERQAILSHWRQQVRELPSAQHLDTPTLNDHIPALLEELAAALQVGSSKTIPEALNAGSAEVHGLQRLKAAFDIEEVVAEYNILRAGIHDLATTNGLQLQGQPFHVINRVFDRAIGLALQAYATQRALEVQQRREEYLGFVAHDLRTPLFAISLAGRVLEQQLPQRGYTAEAASMLKSLRRNVQQLEGLVRKVLEESDNVRTDAGIKLVRREFDLWPLIEALIEELQPVAEPAGTQLIDQVPDDLRVYADASVLKRVFQNLIANAITYTPRGTIVVGARQLGTSSDVECWVSDTGAGMPGNFLAQIFDKGEADPTRIDATGLGLAIVRSFIEAHGGQIGVESKEGEGSIFRFSLPGNERVQPDRMAGTSDPP
jgi:signal transduction histidine kinase